MEVFSVPEEAKEAIAFDEGSEVLLNAVATLTHREREVLYLRTGITTGEVLTLREVGRRFSVTVERIRQIQVKALYKLQRPGCARTVEPFVMDLRKGPVALGWKSRPYDHYGQYLSGHREIREFIECSACTLRNYIERGLPLDRYNYHVYITKLAVVDWLEQEADISDERYGWGIRQFAESTRKKFTEESDHEQYVDAEDQEYSGCCNPKILQLPPGTSAPIA